MYSGPINPLSCPLPSACPCAEGTLGWCQPNLLHPNFPLRLPPCPILLPFSLPPSLLHGRLQYGHKQTCKAAQRALTAREVTTRRVCRPAWKQPHAAPRQIKCHGSADPVFPSATSCNLLSKAWRDPLVLSPVHRWVVTYLLAGLSAHSPSLWDLAPA